MSHLRRLSVLGLCFLAGISSAQGTRSKAEDRHGDDCSVEPPGCAPADATFTPVLDAWSPLATFVNAEGNVWMSPIHATLMPTREILFLGWNRDAECVTTYPCAPSFQWGRHAWILPVDGEPEQTYQSASACYPADREMVQFRVLDNIYENQLLPLADRHDLFCSGHTLLENGDVFTAGGTYYPLTPCPIGVCGLTYGAVYERYTGRLRQLGNMVGLPDYCPPLPCASCSDEFDQCVSCRDRSGLYNTAMRWYPTCTRLHDGRVMITGGFTQTFLDGGGGVQLYEGLQNNSIEFFDPSTRSYELLLPSRRDDALQNLLINRDYTHITLLPEPVQRRKQEFDLLLFGQHGVPMLLDLDSSTTAKALWASEAPGCRPNTPCPDLNCDACSGVGASSVPLPIRVRDGEWGYSNGSMLIAGGAHDSSHQRSFDVYDPVRDEWLFDGERGALDTARHHPATVLLPDGKIAVVGGHSHAQDRERLQQAFYIDPREGFRGLAGIAEMGQPLGHGYHAVSLLMPDGRVLLAGGRDQETDRFYTERPTFEFLYPPYFSKKRIKLLVVSDRMRLGKSYDIFTDKSVKEVVLMGLGSMTHSFDMNQRYVELEVKRFLPRLGGNPSKQRAQIQIPDSARVLPPGFYMLFALDQARVPSRARIIHVGA